MRQSRPSGSLSLVLARAVALFVLVPALGLALAIEVSSGTVGSAGAATAAPTDGYGGGQMMAADPNGGYWTTTAGGAVTPHDGAPTLGSPARSGLQLAKPIVGMAQTPDGDGYWLVASDGGIFNCGDAEFYGSAGSIHLNRPIVGMAPALDGAGYWLVASDGGIFSYGDAVFYGSTGSIHLNRPIVGMAPTADGAGYLLVASDGGIFNYGDAEFYGSTGSIRLNQPIVGVAPTADGAGYWLVAADGGVFTFGDAGYYGSTAGTGVSAIGLVIDPPAPGYAVVTSTGSATLFGPGMPAGVTEPATTTTRPPATTTTTAPPSIRRTIPTPTTTTTTTAPPPSTTTSPATTGLQLGSYNGAANPLGATAFASETGTAASIYSDYLDGSSWSAMVGTSGSPPWVISQMKGHLGNMRLLLSVPLVNAGYSDDQAALAAYAANPATWDSNFTILAQNLVADGFSNAIIRLMWEPDSGIYSSDDLTSAANYATLWRDAYTAMASVSGANFQWAWYWGANFDAVTNTTAYPGNSYVNYVTFDFYDQSWDGSCSIPYNGSNFTGAQESCLWSGDFDGVLSGLASFASAHDKPIGIGEFGVIDRSDGHGGGDDPTFLNRFSAWMNSNNVAWASYFNFNSGGNSILADYPNSLAAYKADLG
jgi:hypothetical protein